MAVESTLIRLLEIQGRRFSSWPTRSDPDYEISAPVLKAMDSDLTMPPVFLIFPACRRQTRELLSIHNYLMGPLMWCWIAVLRMNISPLFPILRWSACLFKAAALLLEQELHLHSFPESWGCSSDASFALKLKVDLRCRKEPSLNSCYAPHRERCCYPHFTNEDPGSERLSLRGEKK